MLRHRSLAVAAAALVPLVGLTTPAAVAADPATRAFVFKGVGTHVEQEIGSCLDVPFPLRHDADVHAVFQERVQHGQLHVSVRFWNRNTFTNEDTGAAMYGMSQGSEVDRRITENPDGTLTIVFETSARHTYREVTGGLIGILDTTQTAVVVIDPMGTPLDLEDDVLVSEEWSEPEVRVVGDGGNECEVAAAYLG